jgi:hypothetical protein
MVLKSLGSLEHYRISNNWNLPFDKNSIPILPKTATFIVIVGAPGKGCSNID